MSRKRFDLIEAKIKRATKVFIVGHKNIDLDAFGASLGLYYYALYNNKEAFIIIDEKNFEQSVKKVIATFKSKVKIINSKVVKTLCDEQSILIIVDTNKLYLIQNEDISCMIKEKIVIDHHNLTRSSISENDALIYNDTSVSSTCEIVASMLDYHKCLVEPDVATILLSGIVLDTNNFVIRTNTDTYYAAYYLTKCGADPKEVQYLFKQDIKEYAEMQKVITEVKVIKNIAVSKGLQTRIYRREELAKIADVILLFNNIEVSFVIGKTNEGIGISARSMGNISVAPILETFGGGGDTHEAAAIIKDKKLSEVFELVVKKASDI